MIEMRIMGIAIDLRTGSPIIILNDAENRRALPIWIGQAEASAIIRILESVETPRPMTHDLICNILDTTSNFVEKIEINDLDDSTYFATIFLKNKEGKEFKIDSRPSDAIAIALKNKAPIFVAPNVVIDGTISTDEERDEKETEEFKDFVRNIKPSDFKKLINEKLNPDEPNDEEN
ncbi:MAG TPA: bifunctional nuclease family protein [Candidatus Gastranaerophilales bacterium]|nr:bifunctional nuclease family protein [Candidatus Gastranaerophilales bacterium]